MPRPPKGLFKRGNAWYVRLRRGGRDKWLSLGSEYQEACRRHRALRRAETEGKTIEGNTTVGQAAEQWLELRVGTARNAAGVILARTRVKRYLLPFFGVRPVAGICQDDLRRYRLCLEGQKRGELSISQLLPVVRGGGLDRPCAHPAEAAAEDSGAASGAAQRG